MQTLVDAITAGWWLCAECGAEVQLPATETTGYVLTCPDCPGEIAPMWEWDDQRAS
jgi:hypothetical protein